MTRSLMFGLLSLAVLATALVGSDALRAVRGCGLIPLDSSVGAPLQPPSIASVDADERERRARVVMSQRSGLPIEQVVVHERAAHGYPNGITAYTFKVYGLDGRYLGPIFLDAAGGPLSEDALALAGTIEDVRDHGKVDAQLSQEVARTLPWDAVPVTFQLVAPPWDGPPRPWPLDLPPDAWNEFVERHADSFYRPRVVPLIEHLRSIGARDMSPDLAAGEYVKGAWVFARVPADQVCSVARRSDVLRAGYNPPIHLN